MYHNTTFYFLLLLALVFLSEPVDGQQASEPSISLFSANATQGKVSGYFHHLDSTGLYYAQTATDLRSASTIKQLPLTSLHTISLRKKGSRGKGAAIGVVAGALTGILLGTAIGKKAEDCTGSFLSFGPCSKAEVTQLLILPSALLGAGIGALFGGEKVRYIIRGKKHRLRAQEEAIRRYNFQQ